MCRRDHRRRALPETKGELMTALRASLASAVVLAVAAATPALAAQPYWTSNGKILKEAQSESVATSGSLAFTVSSKLGPTRTIKCKVTDTEIVENPSGGGAGVDEMTTFSLTGCTTKAVTPCTSAAIIATVGIVPPWSTELFGPAPTIRDRIKGMEIEFKCSNGKVLGNYKGELTPEVELAC